MDPLVTHLFLPDGHPHLGASGYQISGDREHLHDAGTGRCPYHVTEQDQGEPAMTTK